MKELFYKPIKIKHPNEDVLFWGCPHYDHACESWSEPLYVKRGYKTLDEHNRALIDNWNSKASDTTIGFLLGDVMFGKGGLEKFKSFINRLKFDTIYICSGNHTAGWHQAFESVKENVWITDLQGKKVVFVPNYFELFVNGQPVVCSHYPILSWNGMGKGSFMLYSHVHNSLENSEIGKLYKNSGLKAYETSVECNEYPARFSEIQKFMGKQNGGSVDHHNSKTMNPF